MHPVIAHFLDPKAVRTALEKAAKGDALTAIELQFATAAAAHPDRRDRALKPPGDQQAALALAVFAALSEVERDPELAPIVVEARRALLAAGATEDDVQQFLSLVLLEEAFAWDDEADAFDSDLVAETFRTLPALAALDEDRVGALEEGFVHNQAAAVRPLQLAVVQALFGAAWSDGPVPVGPEHVEEALENLRSQTSDVEFPAAAKAIEALLQLLAKEGLVGGQRLKKLLQTARLTVTALAQPERDADEDDDDDDGPPSGEGTRN